MEEAERKDNMEIKFTGNPPVRSHDHDAGFDLIAAEPALITKLRTPVHTGTRVSIPEGHVGLLFARSGLATKQGVHLSNSVGVIDAGYTGEIVVSLQRLDGSTASVQAGDRIAQLVVLQLPEVEFVEVEELDETERGENGFGSTDESRRA